MTPGTPLGPRYTLIRPLGRGGLATAWLAHDRIRGGEVALKLLHRDAELERLRREFWTLRGLFHPCLTRVHDLGTVRRAGEPPVHFYSADLIAGEPLSRVREPARQRAAVVDALHALSFLHALGIRHGDVKADNVMVTPAGRGVLIDLSCSAALSTITAVSGTPSHLAPELTRGEAADARADLYALGVTLRGLGWTDPVIARLLSPDAARRPSSVEAVLEALGSTAPIARPPPGRAPRVLGREAEIAAFVEWMRCVFDPSPAAASGRRPPCAFWLHGPSGVGRTRLLDELKWNAQLRVAVVEGRADAGPRPVETMLEAGLGVTIGPSLGAAIDALERLSAREEPTLFVLDDVHRAEDRALLLGLIRADPRGRVGFLCSSEAPVEPSPGIRAVSLGPLALEPVRAWAGPDVDGAALHELSGGFPAAVEAILARALARDASGHRARTRADLRALARALPERAALPADPDEAHALLVVALSGRAIAPEVLAALEVDPAAVLRLQRAGVLRADARGVDLARPVERAGYLASVDPAVRRALHARFAALDVLDDPARIEHLAGAGRFEEAEQRLDDARVTARPVAYLGAAEALLRGSTGARLRAAEVLHLAGEAERSLSVVARVVRARPDAALAARAYRVAARAYLKLGRPRRALHAARRASTGADDVAPRAECADLSARALRQLDRHREAVDEATRGLALEPPARTAALLHEDVGISASYLGEPETARTHLAEALRLGPEEPRARVRVASYLAILAFREGRLGDAIARYRDALGIAEAHGLDDQTVSAATNLGTVQQQHGDLGAALETYQRALRLAIALAKERTEVSLRFNLAALLTQIGERERAGRALTACLAVARRLGLRYFEGAAALVEGELSLTDGAVAIEAFRRARAIFEADGLLRERLEAELAIADAAHGGGDLREARGALAAAGSLLGQVDAADLRARHALIEARVSIVEGGAARALESLERTLEEARSLSLRPLEAEVELALAAASDAVGAPALAGAHRGRAREIHERMAASLSPALRDVFFRHPARAAYGAAPRSGTRAGGSLGSGLDLRRFLDVNARLNSVLAVDAILEHAMDAAVELTGAERGFVLLSDPDSGALDVRVARNLDRERIGRSHAKISRTIAESVIENDELLLTTDATSDARFRDNASIHAMRLRSVVCVPIRSPDGTLGALYLDNRFQRGRFDESDAATLAAFADQIAIAIRNARLLRTLEHRTAELELRTRDLEREKQRVEALLRGREQQIEQLHGEVERRQRALEGRYDHRALVGRSPAMREVLETLGRVIEGPPVTVLIEGESGTGKELVARAIHFQGERRERPFVTVNCAAMPETLLESELFGHVRGAFTGADRDRQGLFVAADGGTLLLDELGDMPRAMQAKLLRVLQEREVRPLGATRSIPVDVRVVCATNRRLEDEVRAGRFRSDLYYRVGVITLTLPPLRERLADLPELAEALLTRRAEELGRRPPTLAPEVIGALARQPWAGNVRELENTLVRAWIVSGRDRIEVGDLTLERPRAEDRAEEEAARIRAALATHGWNVRAACRALGIPSNTFYRKLKRYGIERPADDGADAQR